MSTSAIISTLDLIAGVRLGPELGPELAQAA